MTQNVRMKLEIALDHPSLHQLAEIMTAAKNLAELIAAFEPGFDVCESRAADHEVDRDALAADTARGVMGAFHSYRAGRKARNDTDSEASGYS